MLIECKIWRNAPCMPWNLNLNFISISSNIETLHILKSCNLGKVNSFKCHCYLKFDLQLSYAVSLFSKILYSFTYSITNSTLQTASKRTSENDSEDGFLKSSLFSQSAFSIQLHKSIYQYASILNEKGKVWRYVTRAYLEPIFFPNKWEEQ